MFGLWVCAYQNVRLPAAQLPASVWLRDGLESAGLPSLRAFRQRELRVYLDWRITAWIDVSTDNCQYQECGLTPLCEELRVQREYYGWPQDSTQY